MQRLLSRKRKENERFGVQGEKRMGQHSHIKSLEYLSLSTPWYVVSIYCIFRFLLLFCRTLCLPSFFGNFAFLSSIASAVFMIAKRNDKKGERKKEEKSRFLTSGQYSFPYIMIALTIVISLDVSSGKSVSWEKVRESENQRMKSSRWDERGIWVGKDCSTTNLLPCLTTFFEVRSVSLLSAPFQTCSKCYLRANVTYVSRREPKLIMPQQWRKEWKTRDRKERCGSLTVEQSLGKISTS